MCRKKLKIEEQALMEKINESNLSLKKGDPVPVLVPTVSDLGLWGNPPRIWSQCKVTMAFATHHAEGSSSMPDPSKPPEQTASPSLQLLISRRVTRSFTILMPTDH